MRASKETNARSGRQSSTWSSQMSDGLPGLPRVRTSLLAPISPAGRNRLDRAMDSAPPHLRIFIDADACPVKDETHRAAARFGLRVFVVANSPIQVPRASDIERVVVGASTDAADDWIAERAGPGAIVVTSDIPLASRCVKLGADVIAPNGKRFSESSIGMALATRNLMDHLRSTGQATSGPKAFGPRDRSNFLSALDNAVVRLQRGDDALLMTPIGVERRAECHAGSRAVRGPAPSFFLVALMERYGTTVSVTAR